MDTAALAVKFEWLREIFTPSGTFPAQRNVVPSSSPTDPNSLGDLRMCSPNNPELPQNCPEATPKDPLESPNVSSCSPPSRRNPSGDGFGP